MLIVPDSWSVKYRFFSEWIACQWLCTYNTRVFAQQNIVYHSDHVEERYVIYGIIVTLVFLYIHFDLTLLQYIQRIVCQTITACFVIFVFSFFFLPSFLFWMKFQLPSCTYCGHLFSIRILCFGQYPAKMCCTREINVVSMNLLMNLRFFSHHSCFDTQYILCVKAICSTVRIKRTNISRC